MTLAVSVPPPPSGHPISRSTCCCSVPCTSVNRDSKIWSEHCSEVWVRRRCKVVKPLGHSCPLRTPRIPTDTLMWALAGHSCLLGHCWRNCRRPTLSGLVTIRAIQISQSGVHLLGGAEGVGRTQCSDTGVDVSASRIGSNAGFT